MRAWHVGVVGVLVVGLAFTGCSASGSDGSKLKKDVIGKWESKSGGRIATVEFKEDGTYTYEANKLKINGKWTAPDAQNIEENFTLTRAEADLFKPQATLMTDMPEPVEGENTWTLPAEVKETELTLAGQKYTKK